MRKPIPTATPATLALGTEVRVRASARPFIDELNPKHEVFTVEGLNQDTKAALPVLERVLSDDMLNRFKANPQPTTLLKTGNLCFQVPTSMIFVSQAAHSAAA